MGLEGRDRAGGERWRGKAGIARQEGRSEVRRDRDGRAGCEEVVPEGGKPENR